MNWEMFAFWKPWIACWNDYRLATIATCIFAVLLVYVSLRYGDQVKRLVRLQVRINKEKYHTNDCEQRQTEPSSPMSNLNYVTSYKGTPKNNPQYPVRSVSLINHIRHILHPPKKGNQPQTRRTGERNG